MKRLLFLLVLLPGLAQAGPLADAALKLDDMDFEGAIEQVRLVLKAPGVQPADLVSAYKILGLSLASTGKEDEARNAFRKGLSIDPKLDLPTDISPKLTAIFYQAKAIGREGKPISLSHDQTGPRKGEDRQVKVVLESDPMNMVRGIHLCQGQSQGDWQCGQTFPISKPGPATFQLDQAQGDTPVLYFFEALTEQGAVLSRAGSRDKAFGQVSEPVAPTDPELKDKDDPWAGDGPEEKPAFIWYDQWWVWTAVGVVVVGTAVGLGVGLSQDTGGPIDYRVSVE